MRTPTLALAATMAVLAGCVASVPPPRLEFSAAWQAWGDETHLHLLLDLRNTGAQDALLGGDSGTLRVTGPGGAVPLAWGDASLPRAIAPGERLTLTLHPRANATGAFVLALDHAAPHPMGPPPGEYVVCVQGDCMTTEVP